MHRGCAAAVAVTATPTRLQRGQIGAWVRQDWRTAALNSSGRSRLLTCPALGITTRCASEIVRSNWRATLSGDRTSCSPQISKVGTVIRGSRSRWSASAITRSATRKLSGRTSAAISASSEMNAAGGSPKNKPGRVGSNSSAGAASIRCTLSTRARTSSSDSDPFQPAYVSASQGRHKLGMVAVELQDDYAAPGDAGDMRRAELDRLDQRREAVRVLREAEISGYVRGTACARPIPSNDRELVGQRSELGLPDAAVLPGSMHKRQRRSFADALVRDLEPAYPDNVHGHASAPIFPRMQGKNRNPRICGGF